MQASTHPTAGIVGGNPLGQGEEGREPGVLTRAQEFHVLDPFPPRQQGAPREPQDIEQRRFLRPLNTAGLLRSDNAQRSTR